MHGDASYDLGYSRGYSAGYDFAMSREGTISLNLIDGKLAARSWTHVICPTESSLPAGLIAQDHIQRFVEGQTIPGGRPYWIYNDTDAAMPWWG